MSNIFLLFPEENGGYSNWGRGGGRGNWGYRGKSTLVIFSNLCSMYSFY